MSTVFFNGRSYTTPAVMSAVVDTAMNAQSLSVGNVAAFIGRSSGGKPNTVLTYGSPDEAAADLIDGELLTAIKKAFDPSSETTGPATIIAIRVNPATQASLTLNDSTPAAAINLVSTGYGLYTNQIKVKVEAATNYGTKLTTQMGSSYYSQDDVYRKAFSLQYAGAQASATMTISGTTLTLAAPTGTTVATIDLATYPTVQQVVDRINAVASFSATVLEGNGAKATLNALDYVTSVDVKTALYTVRADLQAAIDWINGTGEGYITATRASNAGKPPATLAFTYLSGGSDGTTTNTEWSNAYTTLQTADVQWVTPISSDPAIHAMNDAHCVFMSNTMFRERRGICGMPSGSTNAAAITAAAALNSDRTSLVHLGYYDYDANSNLVLMPPYMTAALIAGAFSGVSPGTALTNKSIKVRGLERLLRKPTETDALINGGVLCVHQDDDGSYKVVQSISTWLTDEKYNRVEVSCGAAVDYMMRTVRTAHKVLIGQKAGPLTLGRAVSLTTTALTQLAQAEPVGPGILVGDADSPAFTGVTASLVGDVIAVKWQASPVIPVNFVESVAYIQPYSGTATAAA